MINTPEQLKRAFTDAQLAEEKHFRFKVITQISVDDAIKFYAAAARFPDQNEIKLIKEGGIESVIKLISC